MSSPLRPSTVASLRRPEAPRATCSTPTSGYEWGPDLSERAWGTVREDYSENVGTAHQKGWTAVVADVILYPPTTRKPDAASVAEDMPRMTRDLIGPT